PGRALARALLADGADGAHHDRHDAAAAVAAGRPPRSYGVGAAGAAPAPGPPPPRQLRFQLTGVMIPQAARPPPAQFASAGSGQYRSGSACTTSALPFSSRMLRLPPESATRLEVVTIVPRPSDPTRTFTRSPEWYGWFSVTGTLCPWGPRSRWLPAAAHGVQLPTSCTWTPWLPAGRPCTVRKTSTSFTPSLEGRSMRNAEPTQLPSRQLLIVAFALLIESARAE